MESPQNRSAYSISAFSRSVNAGAGMPRPPGCPGGQCVTDCPRQIAAFGPLDRSLLPARRTEFAGMPRLRACLAGRYRHTIGPTRFDSSGIQITVYRDAPAGNALRTALIKLQFIVPLLWRGSALPPSDEGGGPKGRRERNILQILIFLSPSQLR